MKGIELGVGDETNPPALLDGAPALVAEYATVVVLLKLDGIGTLVVREANVVGVLITAIGVDDEVVIGHTVLVSVFVPTTGPGVG